MSDVVSDSVKCPHGRSPRCLECEVDRAGAKATMERIVNDPRSGDDRRAPSVESQVDHPAHYNAGGMEVIDVIEAFGLDKNFALGNAVKYILRAGKKGSLVTDLKKARWYLDREINRASERLDG